MKHTPGPWKVIEKRSDPRVAWVQLGTNKRYVLSGLVHEDADLIAAAPELLELARMMNQKDAERWAMLRKRLLTVAERELLRRALAKVEGRDA